MMNMSFYITDRQEPTLNYRQIIKKLSALEIQTYFTHSTLFPEQHSYLDPSTSKSIDLQPQPLASRVIICSHDIL